MPGLPARPAGCGPAPARPAGPRSSARTDDDVLAAVLISTWSLATGRILRSDVPPGQLTEDELIRFWADDAGQAPSRHAMRSLGPAGETR